MTEVAKGVDLEEQTLYSELPFGMLLGKPEDLCGQTFHRDVNGEGLVSRWGQGGTELLACLPLTTLSSSPPTPTSACTHTCGQRHTCSSSAEALPVSAQNTCNYIQAQSKDSISIC